MRLTEAFKSLSPPLTSTPEKADLPVVRRNRPGSTPSGLNHHEPGASASSHQRTWPSVTGTPEFGHYLPVTGCLPTDSGCSGRQ